MSNDVKHPNLDDLLDGEDTEGDDVSMDGSDTEESQESDDSQSDSQDEQDNLLDESLKAEKAKQQFAEAWAKKIESGKATLDELKEKQAWLAPDVEALLQKPAVNPSEIEKLAEQAARRLLEEERNKQQSEENLSKFEALKKQIAETNPSSEQKRLLVSKFDSLKGKLDPHEALSLAAEVAQIDFDGTVRKRASMALPRASYATASSKKKIDIDRVDPNSLSADQLRAFVQENR